MADPIGSLIAPPGQYTHCVGRSAYKDIPTGWEAGVPSILKFVLCEYLLGGKLVCLAGGGDECAIGRVVGIEEVGYQKSGFDAIDNDFSFNLLVLPYRPADFVAYRENLTDPTSFEAHTIRDDVVAHSPLGRLMVDPTPSPVGLPAPREPGGTSPVDGYGVRYTWDGSTLVYDHENQNNLHKLWEKHAKDGSGIAVPIVHCECEGSRIAFVCMALSPFLDALTGHVPGSGLPSPSDVCHATLDWLPFGIGKAVCSIIEDIIAAGIAIALAPAMAAAFASAWEAAQIFDDLFVTGPVAKQIHIDDIVVVTGRWTWDAGHAGHTELHPVKSIQKVKLAPDLEGGHDPRKPLPGPTASLLDDVRERWCRYVREAPPPPDPRHEGGLSGAQLASLTPAQLAVYVRQRRPENRWEIHPSVDGCAPEREPDPIH